MYVSTLAGALGLVGRRDNYVLVLTMALSFQGRAADSLTLLHAYGGEGVETLRLRLSGWPTELSATAETGDSQATVAFLEGYAGLRPEDYRSPSALAARLATILGPWTENAAAAYIFELLRGLQACLRARALNDARKSFFGDGTRLPLWSHVGLNTAAGCGLFGLG
jgi:hypothetical protein